MFSLTKHRISARRYFNISSIAASISAAVDLKTPVTPELVSNILNEVTLHNISYGFHTNYFRSLPSEDVVVEFSSPNIAKLFHVGHYRSTVVGNTISNVLSAAGHRVHKINYLGDWGIQFALLAVAFERYGSKELLNAEPLKHLYDLYVKVSNQVKDDKSLQDEAQVLFAKMEKGEKDSLRFWEICRDLSVTEYKKLYAELGIFFDEYTGESNYVVPAKTVLDILKKKSLSYSDESALKIDLSNSLWLAEAEERHKHPVLARSSGTTLYLTRDVAAAIERYERLKFDRMIYVTDISQTMHFKQLFGILEALGHSWAQTESGKLIHKSFGRVQKMQTRKGNIVLLNDILEEAYQRAYEDRRNCETRKASLNENEITKTLALSGLIYHDLKSRLHKGYKFSWENALASKGSSGLYLQYTYSRLCSLERNTGVRVTDAIDSVQVLQQPPLVSLLQLVNEYPSTLERLYENLEPSILVRYLFELSRLAARAFESCVVKGKPGNVAEARLACFHCARIVLGNGLKILGITPLEQH